MIEVSHLTRSFGELKAVDDVSFSVAAGECVGFLGPNGAGKTTTMRTIAGIFPPTSGTVKVAGHDVVRESDAARRRLGYFPEHAPFYPELAVEEYLAFVARAKRLPRAARALGATAALIHTDLGTGDHDANMAMAAWLGPALDALAGPGGYILANQSLEVGRWRRLPEPPQVPKDRYFLYRVS